MRRSLSRLVTARCIRSALAAAICVAVPATVSSAMAQDRSADYNEPYQQTAFDIYRHLVEIRSAAGHGKVPMVADYLAERFRKGGFPAEDVHVLRQVVSSGEEVASLVVRYPGDGSSGRKPILLIGHMDVVDALPEDWERDPFTLIEEDGYFFGRGSYDDKFGVTALTATFLRLKAEGFVPTRDLVIAFSGDEETGMETTQALANEHRTLTDAEFVLNADGGGGVLDHEGNAVAFMVQAAEKTYATFELTLRNPGGHSSQPRPDNAIYELASVLRNIEAYAFPVQTNAITRGYFEATGQVTDGEVGVAMQRFAANPEDAEAQAVLSAVPELNGVMRTTCIATMLSAGHAENALPQSAAATVNCRIFPGVEVDTIRATLFELADNPALEIATLDKPEASPASPMNEEITAAVTNAVHARYPGIPIVPYMAPYGTDGKHTRIAGMPTYGVMGLFIAPEDVFAHGLNERVPVASFYGALEHWYSILTELAGS